MEQARNSRSPYRNNDVITVGDLASALQTALRNEGAAKKSDLDDMEKRWDDKWGAREREQLSLSLSLSLSLFSLLFSLVVLSLCSPSFLYVFSAKARLGSEKVYVNDESNLV